MHHNHRTGKFIDALCNSCNLQIQNRLFLPVVFHNLKNYDAHHVFKYVSKRLAAKYDEDKKVSFDSVEITALNLEKKISFKIQYLRFIYSYQFPNAGLQKIVQNVAKESFCHSRKHLGDNDLVSAKVIFPYEWFDSFGKFNETELPSMDTFHNKMEEEGITLRLSGPRSIVERSKIITTCI
jgi:hypothetical protein